ETYTPQYKEIEPEKNPIIMIALYGQDLRKVFVWKHFRTNLDYVEFVGSEAELIDKFKETVENYKPDVLTGYFSDGFDLPYIKTRADKYKIKLDFGLDFSELKIESRRYTTAQITGIIHLDIFKFIRKIVAGTMETETYNLGAVASEMLGEKKHDVDLDELSKDWDEKLEEMDKFCEYNLNDALLSYKLSEKLFPTISEMVKITGLTIYDVNRAGFSQLVEWYLMRQAPNFNEIAPNKPTNDEVMKRRMQTYKGAFVFEPKPGLYDNIVVFDYRSLYPTIIGSHNISPGTINCGCCEGTEKAPLENSSIWFCKRKKGFIPALIEELITRRMRIKEIIKDEKDEKFAVLDARQNSLKLLANSFYGYLGFFAARWYSIECA
ncbi:MAG: DNA-directed DNA polymerase, partial [Nanoarchaeota archaeon]